MLKRNALKGMIALSLALPLMTATISAGNAAGLTDAAIIAIYNQVNSFDIETALVGQVMGNSADVRAFGEMVSGDHTGVRSMAHALAGEINVVPDLPASRADAAKMHYDAIVGLREKSGTDFDRAYLLHEIAFHTAAIDAVENGLLPAATHPKLKEHFKAVLPHFVRHLNEAKRIAKKLDIK